MRDLDDAIAIERSRQGDGDAFETLVLRYGDIAFRTAYLITGDVADAEDAAQSGFVKAYLALGRFRTGEPFRPWLLTIVANEARNRRSQRARRQTVDLETVGGLLPAPESDAPEAIALQADRARHLTAALNRLADEDRTVITLRYLLELNEAEMAAAMGCARGTVKSRLSRALGRLRQEIGAGGEDWTMRHD